MVTTSACVVVYVRTFGLMLAAFEDDENALTRVTASETTCSWASRHGHNHRDRAAATQISTTRACRCVGEDLINMVRDMHILTLAALTILQGFEIIME